MKKVFGILLFTVAVLLPVSLIEPAPAEAVTLSRAADEHDDAREALRRGDIRPYSEIKRIVESQVDGRVVGQKLRRTNRGWQYDLRVRPKNGRVMVLVVDAKTGRIISRRGAR